jgi:hypothetical protein
LLVRNLLEDMGVTYGEPLGLNGLDLFEQNHGYLAQAEFSIVTGGLEAPVAVESWIGQLKLGCGFIIRHRRRLAESRADLGLVLPFLGDAQKAHELAPDGAAEVREALDDLSPERLTGGLVSVVAALRENYDAQPASPVDGLDGVVVVRQGLIWLLRGMLLQLIRSDDLIEPSDDLVAPWREHAVGLANRLGLPYLEH